VQVTEQWKGAQTAQSILLSSAALRNITQSYPERPWRHQEYILFLWTSRSGLTRIGLSQGAFNPTPVSGDSMVTRSHPRSEWRISR
jgi:hypothetical protein